MQAGIRLKVVSSVLKLRLYPDEKTSYCLNDQSRKCCSLYNNLLEEANQEIKEAHETNNKELLKNIYSPYGLRNRVPRMKEQHPYLKSVYAAPLKNAALRLTHAFQAYAESVQGKRKGKRVQKPRFHAHKAQWFSLLYDEPYKGYKIIGSSLHVSLGMGIDRKRHSIQISLPDAHLLRDKDVRNMRIVKEHGEYSAVFTISRTVPQTKPIKKIIAFDPNHKNLFYGVDNEGCAHEIPAPLWLKRYDQRIDEIRSKLDKCSKKSIKVEIKTDTKVITYWRPSRKYTRLKNTLNRALAKRRELIKLYCYRIANQLCKQYDFIAIGDYAPQGAGMTTAMRRSMNNRSLIAQCKRVIAWVAIKSGKTYYEYDEKGTTRTCHACGFVNQNGIHPSIRTWLCSGCLIFHNRDENAACNGLMRAYKSIEKISGEKSQLVPSSGRVYIKERWAWEVLSSGAIKRRGGKTADPDLHFQEIKSDSMVAVRPLLA